MDLPTHIDPDSLFKRAERMIAARTDLPKEDRDFFMAALDVARHAPVTRPHNPQHVFFTITGQPTKRNKMRAMDYLKKQGDKAQIIDHTPVGLLLESMSDRLFDTDYDAAYAVWHVASARYAAAAKGDVHVEWTDINEHSTSEQIEAPVLLANPAVTAVNGTDKHAAITGLLVHHTDRRKGIGLRYHLYKQQNPANDNDMAHYARVLGHIGRAYPDVMKTANKMADELGVERAGRYVPQQKRRRPRRFGFRP